MKATNKIGEILTAPTSHAAIRCGIFLIMVLVTSLSRADDQGYLDHWAGDVRVELQLPGAAGQPDIRPLPAEQVGAPQSLHDQIEAMWQGNRQQVCDELQAALRKEGATGWYHCQLSPTGELRGRMPINPTILPNVVYLKYVVAGNWIEFEAEDSADIRADFDIELRLTVVFDTTVDGRQLPAGRDVPPLPPAPPEPLGAPYLTHPAALTSAIFSLERSRFSSDNVFVTDRKLREAERKFNATSRSLPEGVLNLRELNRGFHKGANQLAKLLPTLQPNSSGVATPFFNLAVLISPGRDFVIRYQRFADPPTPLVGCRCMESCDNGVSCVCPAAGLTGQRFSIERQMPDGTWVSVGSSNISMLEGSALGARSGETVTFRVCASNEWGSQCGAPISFTYRELGRCTFGGGGGGIEPKPRCVRGLFGVLQCRPLPQ